MGGFQHDGLEVYRMAVQFVAAVAGVVERVPRNPWFIGDQLLRAASSVSLNICEGAAEFSPHEKARYYRMARRSAAQSAGCLDVLVAMKALNPTEAAPHRTLLNGIAGKLTRMVAVVEARRDQPPRSRSRPRSPNA